MDIIQTIGAPLGIILTVSVLSYLLFGDNPLYKLALHIFIGALAGYSFGVVGQKIALVLLRDLPGGGRGRRRAAVRRGNRHHDHPGELHLPAGEVVVRREDATIVVDRSGHAQIA